MEKRVLTGTTFFSGRVCWKCLVWCLVASVKHASAGFPVVKVKALWNKQNKHSHECERVLRSFVRLKTRIDGGLGGEGRMQTETVSIPRVACFTSVLVCHGGGSPWMYLQTTTGSNIIVGTASREFRSKSCFLSNLGGFFCCQLCPSYHCTKGTNGPPSYPWYEGAASPTFVQFVQRASLSRQQEREEPKLSRHSEL